MRKIKEVFIATAFVMTIIFLLSFLPFKSKLVKPIKQELSDFDIFDLHFSGSNKADLTKDTDIVLIEAGPGKKEIADQLTILNALEPSVIGLDIMFQPSDDSLLNFYLTQAIKATRSIVFVSKLSIDKGRIIDESSFFADSLLKQNEGYGNFTSFNDYSVIRRYAPFLEKDGKQFTSFTSRIIEKYSPQKFEFIRRRKHATELINYTGNAEHYTSFAYADLYGDYLRSGQLKDKIKGKIVLLGAFKKEPPFILEDLHFTPLNEKITGKSYPDMYGLVIHANILSMILHDNFLRVAPAFISYLIAAILVFFVVRWLWNIYRNKKRPARWRLFLLQVIGTILFVFICLVFFNLTEIRVQMLPVIFASAGGVELFGIYRFLAKWMHKKWKYETIFSQ